MLPIILDAKTKPFPSNEIKKNIKEIYAYHDYLKSLNTLYNNSFYPLWCQQEMGLKISNRNK